MRPVAICALAIFGLAALAPADEARDARPLQVGFAETDITPDVGYPMAGYYHERLAEGTSDPLKAKAIVWRGATQEAAMLVCDLTGIAVDLAQQVRQRAAMKTGIPAANIVVSATHSHTAPDYSKDLHLVLGGKPPAAPRAAYIAKLIDQSVAAIVQAHEAARPATLHTGSGAQAPTVSFCRRFVMRDGSVRTWMSLENPDVVRAAAPIDPEVGVLVAKSAADGKPIGVLSNFALHLDTVGGMRWAADYPFHIERRVQAALAPGVVSVFATGCCGDINHSDPSRRERNKCDTIGNAIGDTVVRELGRLRPLARDDLQVRSQVVRLPLQDVALGTVPAAIATVRAAQNKEKVEFFEHVVAYKRLILDRLRQQQPAAGAESDLLSWGLSHTWAGVGDALPVEVHTIVIGDELALVFLPGEVFVELGLAIKQGSPYRTTMVVELTNCIETLYVPTRGACAQGGYEVLNSALKPGGGEMLVEAALGLLRASASAKPATR